MRLRERVVISFDLAFPVPSKMKRNHVLLVLLWTTLSTYGCSTITQSENQTLALNSMYEGKQVQAECTLTNDKGAWSGKSPGNVSVRKSAENLNVACKAPEIPDGLLTAISRAAGSMFGNIIFGGGIGAIIDHSKGTGYNYPDILPVKMGEAALVDRRDQQQAQQKEAAQSDGATPGAGSSL